MCCTQSFPGANTRRVTELWLLLGLSFLVLMAHANGYSGELFVSWFCLVFLIIVDFLFLDDDNYVFDPSYASWMARTTPSNYD
eukprot:g32122.t1